MQKTALRNK